MRYPLFSLFDAPDGNEPCARRYVSTTAPRALTLLNDKLILGYARDFAARVRHECGPPATDAALIDHAVRLAFGRPPEAGEAKALEKFLKDQTEMLHSRDAALVDLCHALVNVNEFLMVD